MTTTEPDTTTAPTLRVTSPADLLQAIPYLLGFHPQDSLVLVGLADARLVVTVRIDLADLADLAGEDVLANAVEAMCRGGAAELIAAVYDDRCTAAPQGYAQLQALPWKGVAVAVADECTRLGCTLGDALLVADGRWWSYTCGNPACCPPQGQELPAGPSALSATATYAGMVALPDRAALAAILEPLPDSRRDLLTPRIAECENAAVQAVLDGAAVRAGRAVKRVIFAAARASAAPPDSAGSVALDDATVARFGVALTDLSVRDAVWMAVDDGRLDGRELWRELGRRLPSPYDAAPLFLFGWCSWRAGNGALAGIAAERAVDSDTSYSAADLLLAALARGVDPRRLPKLRLPRSA